MRVTRAEALYIDRKRRGETQEDAARRHGVRLATYLAWERGTSVCPVLPRAVRDIDKFVLLRRRAGVTQQQLAGQIGCSVTWLSLMERGLAPQRLLEEYWCE